MKKITLKTLDVQELNTTTMRDINGGSIDIKGVAESVRDKALNAIAIIFILPLRILTGNLC